MDLRLRRRERAALQGGPQERRRYLRERLRQEPLLSAFVAQLSSEDALRIAGYGAVVYYSLTEALARYLEGRGFERFDQLGLEVRPQVVAICTARARLEWKDPLAALGVLRNRRLVRQALGIRRMPHGTRREELRLRARDLGELLEHEGHLRWTDAYERLARGIPADLLQRYDAGPQAA